MMRKRWVWLVVAALTSAVAVSGAAQAGLGGRLGEILRREAERQQGPDAEPTLQGEAFHAFVERHAASIDGSLRALAGSNPPKDGATKVVPILSVGQGKALGVAQVAGPAAAVREVQAVVAVEASLLGRKLHGRVLIPVNTRDILRGYQRVGQVGVAAMLDYRF